MTPNKFTSVLTSAAFMLFSFTVNAQSNEKKADEPSGDLENFELAAKISTLGYSKKDPVLLLTAAKIVADYPARPIKTEKQEPSVNPGKVEDKKDKGSPQLDAATLLKDAKDLAKGNQTILTLITDVEKTTSTSSRGRVYGPAYATRKVYGNSTYTDYLLFKAGELAEVAVIGDGDTDLDLYVYDENGNFIGSDTRSGDNCYVSWTPKWQGSFKIVVKNYGSVYNNYVLMSN
ncbi:MAG: hypothetical protein KIS94_10690 [Chitinophagales bacterium]|nr:hypothetical protein [Chitinophagales bacterium]